ncbi:cyclin-domain-containing protein [Globomyces pollinis-pini]|nr:cyclin-domain-containing protein [Globomyces pollinis-pini]
MYFPERFEDADLTQLQLLIVNLLNRLVLHNDRIPIKFHHLSRFHSRSPPSITISNYLERIVKYSNVTTSTVLCIVIYLDRVCSLQPDFIISSLTIHRFLLVSITCGSKAFCDSFLPNRLYAKVGGLDVEELGILEFEFLKLIDWNLSASIEVIQQYYTSLIKQISPDYYSSIITYSSTSIGPPSVVQRMNTEFATS